MFKVLIIGSGNIGYRHFEGLLKTDLSLVIYVIDPNVEALNRVQKCYEESNSEEKTCYFFESIKDIPDQMDLCIIATSSKVRLEVAETLLKTTSVKYLILEKVLFQKESDYDQMSSLLKEYNVKGCWVNCPLRTFPIFRDLKEKIKTSLSYYIEYRNFGIGCNSIHQLDLFSFLTNCLDLKIETSKLENVVESKREGYLEVLGILTASTNKEDTLIISSNIESSPRYFMKLKFNEEIWTIFPLLERITVEGTQNNEIIEKVINYPKQSSITSLLVTELLLLGKCSLPDYETSKKLHVNLIKNLNTFFSKVLDHKVIECPIT
ncbi:Gfo/Idh/MocA family oxidoreductase [Peribacillus sp. FSL K6-1552]|uniref:Gfo/Idh/MocA family oxidoreductase n=1 Tax=Peribacillus sp. FSL K6-1552 TaxID=2954514 RepID=UPI0030FCCCC1